MCDGTQECKFGREMVQVLCGVFERELEWGVCVCVCVCTVGLGYSWHYMSLGIIPCQARLQ